SIILSSTLGIGVMFSAFVILVYQGGITLFSIFIQPWLNLYPMMIVDIGIVGSVVIIGLGLKMMKISDIKVANLIPAIFMPILMHVLLSII
ncbi:MAG: DUF554 family protein, partial [Erysipelotrichaceae bacterium]